MKRLFAMILALATALCLYAAASHAETENPDPAAFQAFMAANTGKEMRTRHANVLMTRTTFFDGTEVGTENCYRDADTFLWNYNDGRALLRTADRFIDLGFGADGLYGRTIFDSAEDLAGSFEWFRDTCFIILLDGEEPVRCYDTEDGLFIAETRCADPSSVKQALAETGFTGSYQYTDGMVMNYRYIFDRETSDLVRTESFLADSEGRSNAYQVETFAYDVETYDPSADGEFFADYLAAVPAPEDLRTVRIVFDPDTENEKAVEEAFPLHTCFSVFHNGAFIRDFYIDRECTQIRDSYEVTEDLVLYVRTE